MSRLPVLSVVLASLLFGACAPSSGGVEPVLNEGQQVGPGALRTPELEAVAAMRPADRLYQVPLDETSAVFVRRRDGAAPMMFATSCGLLTEFELPSGWEGRCLERVVDGRLETGVFLYSAVK